MARRVSDRDYARLLRIRTQLRRFEHWSAERAAEQGLTASQHQLLLAVRGHPDEAGPTIGQVADYLLIRHNSAVELVDRTEQSGLLRRERDSHDHRVVRLTVTSEGSRRLEALSGAHLDELAALAPLLEETVNTTVLPEQPGAPTEPRTP